MAKILVIEDESRMADLLKRGLEESGHMVTMADGVASGRAAFSNGVFDIVVSDVMLPDGSGFDLCRTIRAYDE